MEVKKLKNRKIILISLTVVLLLGATTGYKLISNKKDQAELAKKTSASLETKKDVVITSSGTIKSANRFEIIPIASGRVNKVYFKEGDKVNKDNLMFELDSIAAETNVKKLTNAIDQAMLEMNNNGIDIGKLTLKAPFGGQVSNILVKKGDMISKGSPVLTVADRSKMKLTVPFNSKQIQDISTGLRAAVYLQDTNQVVEGTVAYVNTGSYATERNGKLFNVEILIDNPGAVKEGLRATAEVNLLGEAVVLSPESGVLTYVNSSVLKSDSDGKVEDLDLKEDQLIEKGDMILTLKNDSLINAKESIPLKIKDLQIQLDYAQKQLEDCKIYAPIDGTISKQTIKPGEVPKAGEIISTLVDLEHMELVVPIDDVDIANIKLGQKVVVKVDALSWTSEKPLEGKVEKIPIEGNTVNGTTTYPVTISLNNISELKPGMNANIEIKIEVK